MDTIKENDLKEFKTNFKKIFLFTEGIGYGVLAGIFLRFNSQEEKYEKTFYKTNILGFLKLYRYR
ncbi:MAG: hypothetical protein HUU44_15625 [Ignavibacteriaceae bacterium]|nr:hypothetical protein [Ignavibacteriaceae bacterium]